MMISPQDRNDRLIRATDFDALSCRYSAARRGYINDPHTQILIQAYQKYLQYVHGYTPILASRTLRSVFSEPKFPLINRGTYFRTISLDKVCENFIERHTNAQIVSIGSGSDTRPFKLLKAHPDIKYVEIDFPDSTRVKKLAILGNRELGEVLGVSEELPEITTKEEFNSFSPHLQSEKYQLLGYDLRKDLKELNFSQNPTLVISECVLCYLSFEENKRVISHLVKSIPNLFLAIYEPMSLRDSFGSVMAANLSGRGISIPMFEALPDLPSRKEFLLSLGFKSNQLTNLQEIAGYGDLLKAWIDKEELKRIDKLEIIDEIEEISLLLKHYCLSLSGPTESTLKWIV